jgi:gas vesicle protein
MSISTPSSDPEVLRSQIEETRRELGADVDALADKVTPGKIVQRQTDKVRGAVSSVKDKIMGSASDAGNSLGGVADDASGLAHNAVDKAKGNPLAVGLIAFGVGWLASSLIPASTVEKQVAANVKDAAEPLLNEAKGAAKEMGENLKQPLTDAAEAVKGTATDAAGTVKSETTSSAEEVRDTAKHAGPGSV